MNKSFTHTYIYVDIDAIAFFKTDKKPIFQLYLRFKRIYYELIIVVMRHTMIASGHCIARWL